MTIPFPLPPRKGGGGDREKGGRGYPKKLGGGILIGILTIPAPYPSPPPLPPKTHHRVYTVYRNGALKDAKKTVTLNHSRITTTNIAESIFFLLLPCGLLNLPPPLPHGNTTRQHVYQQMCKKNIFILSIIPARCFNLIFFF